MSENPYRPTKQERESAEAREALWQALGKPDKLYEIASALTAAEERGRRRGVEERDKLRETLKELFALVEEGLLVRNIGNDGDPGWTINAMRIVLALKHAKDALAPRDSGKVEVCRAEVASRMPDYSHYECTLPKGHSGAHREGGAEWTDKDTVIA